MFDVAHAERGKREVRRGELTEDEALRLHKRLTEVRIRLLGDRVSRRTAWRIAREQGWDTIGDAEDLAVTKLQADALIAMDAELARRATGLVPRASPDALVSAPWSECDGGREPLVRLATSRRRLDPCHPCLRD